MKFSVRLNNKSEFLALYMSPVSTGLETMTTVGLLGQLPGLTERLMDLRLCLEAKAKSKIIHY
ncbi:hypothetical protein VCHA54P489_160011 [Vibrio chagasii]|nr:hypothetical protein VCHA54P489_160011 [Vibrio chagasii]CAH7013159.1 hypothetical protein VCHA37P202_150012 [Vibrio chagasii]CAH7039240.1 hypothetical protein VCHA49P380_170133 [Vibrio chagasii]